MAERAEEATATPIVVVVVIVVAAASLVAQVTQIASLARGAAVPSVVVARGAGDDLVELAAVEPHAAALRAHVDGHAFTLTLFEDFDIASGTVHRRLLVGASSGRAEHSVATTQPFDDEVVSRHRFEKTE